LKINNVIGSAQNGSDQFALNANAAAVNDSEHAKPESLRLFQIRFDSVFYIAGSKGVKIENVGNRYDDGLIFFRTMCGLGNWQARNPASLWRRGSATAVTARSTRRCITEIELNGLIC